MPSYWPFPGMPPATRPAPAALLGEALATPETLLPSERALADLMVRDLDARLALTRENETLRNGSSSRKTTASPT